MVHRPLRYYYLRLVRQPGTPEQIAGGMALGLFVALVVPPGLQIVTALALAFVLKLNKISATIGCFLTNPVTWPTIILFQLVCGSYLTGTPMPTSVPTQHESWWDFLHKYHDYHASWEMLRSYLTGAVVTAIVASVVGFYMTRWLVENFRQKKLALLLHRRTVRAKALEANKTAVKPAEPPPHSPAPPPDKTPSPDKSAS